MVSQKYRAYICCGPNCGPKGSGALLDFLAEEVNRMALDEQVSVLPTGCQSHCESGPTMVVYPGPVYYQEVDRDRLRRIVAEHFVKGEPVREYFWTGPRQKRWTDKKVVVGTTEAVNWWESAPKAEEGKARGKKQKRDYEDLDDFKW